MFLDEARFLKQLEVKVIDFEFKADVKLASLLVRAFKRLSCIVSDNFEELDLLCYLIVCQWIVLQDRVPGKAVQITICLFKDVKLQQSSRDHLTL